MIVLVYDIIGIEYYYYRIVLVCNCIDRICALFDTIHVVCQLSRLNKLWLDLFDDCECMNCEYE